MRVLVACEYSGRVRDAFIEAGHDAVSCDLLESDLSGPHYKGDVLDIIEDGWDLMIAHPPCTYITCSAEWAYKEGPYHQKVKEGTLVGEARIAAREDALKFFDTLYNSSIPRIAMENPVGVLSTHFGEPTQYIQPYEYGDNASKKTCLWLKGIPPLVPNPENFYPPRLALNKNGKGYAFRWGNQTDSGQNKEPPSKERWKTRSTTWQGWANAMAEQWGSPN